MLADALSQMYATEVPAYGHLVDATRRVNEAVLSDGGDGAEHRDSGRLGGERHGAIRLASFDELSQIARLFALFAMEAVGYYDLRSSPTPLPIVATAFRPIHSHDLEQSPFRMFTSTLVAHDERFFSEELRHGLDLRSDSRCVLSAELVSMIEAAENGSAPDPQRLVSLTVDALSLDRSVIDQEWFDKLDAVSSVASDIAAATNTHLNHLTPRVLDIEALHQLMEDEGVQMIERIQGPPTWEGPDLLLRQTSFRALDEHRLFATADGQEVSKPVRVRFGEVEQRGIAMTERGRAKLDAAMAAGADCLDEADRLEAIQSAMNANFAHTVEGLFEAGDIFVEFRSVDGELHLEPITYEDFLPASAAGIFASNLARPGADVLEFSAGSDAAERLRHAVGTLHDPYVLYQGQQDASFAAYRGLETDNPAS